MDIAVERLKNSDLQHLRFILFARCVLWNLMSDLWSNLWPH